MIGRRDRVVLLGWIAGGVLLGIAVLCVVLPPTPAPAAAASCPIEAMGVPPKVWRQVRQVSADLAQLKAAIAAPDLPAEEKTRLGQAVDRDRAFLADILSCEGQP